MIPLADVVSADRSALLIVDVQNDNSAPGGFKDVVCGYDISIMTDVVVPNIADVLAEARRVGMLVVFFRNIQRKKGLNRPARWAALQQQWMEGRSTENYGAEGTWGADIVDALQPLPDELVIDKDRSSGFFGTPLDLILRGKGIETIIVVGTATQGCVESTARHGTWLNYLPVVLRDGVGTPAERLHQAALTIMENRYVLVDTKELLDVMHAWPEAAS